MNINLNAQRTNANSIQFVPVSQSSTTIRFSLTDIYTKAIDKYATLVSPATNGYSNQVGHPQLPEYHQIIQIPDCGDFIITIDTEDWSTYSLLQFGCNTPIRPVPKATLKSCSETELTIDSTIYNTDCFYGDQTISLKPIGTMRDYRIAMLTIAPVKYNPVKGEIQICHNISATVKFTNTNITLNPLKYCPLQTINGSGAKEYVNILTSDETPYTYLIVAPRKFQEALQPLVSWKRQEGFSVEEYYPETTNKDVIKAYLQRRYDYATPTRPAPIFILLAGDVQDIPVWVARHRITGLESHRTDLYYAEYTGDYLPDALLGRISTSDTAELRQIISKTLAYERFTLIDSSYLDRSLLVAGKENTQPAPIVTNGQINYLKTSIIQYDSIHDTICYYNPASDTMTNEIHSHLRQGVGFVNYTSHCTTSGWMNPRLSIYDIDSMSLDGNLFLSINNCCRSNEISGDCLGEHLLRKANGGAIGVIGASNETLWNEDYYWSVGSSGTPSLFPQYNADYQGAYDRFFHTHNTPTSQHALTQSQIVTAGNWSVTASGSPYDAFYWEIYSLLGDPSLIPYIGIPKTQTLTVVPITTGDIEIHLQGVPGARVAATLNDSLYGVCTIDNNGNGLMHTRMPVLDTLLFTSTIQDHKPLQAKIAPTQHNGPRLVVTDIVLHDTFGHTVSQLTLCDTALVSVTVHNAGNTAALGHHLTINTSDNYPIATLLPQQDTTIHFTIYPKDHSDLLVLTFETGDSNTYWQHSRTFDILTPNIVLQSATLLHNGIAVTTASPNTSYTLRLNISNTGNGKAKDLQASINGSTTQANDLNPNDSTTCEFSLTTESLGDSLYVTLLISHRADTLTHTLCYPQDSTTSNIVEDIETTGILLYPNPAANNITIGGFTHPTHITVFDTYGRRVKEFFVQRGQTIQYSTHELRCGIYSIHFSNERMQPLLTKKLLIAR